MSEDIDDDDVVAVDAGGAPNNKYEEERVGSPVALEAPNRGFVILLGASSVGNVEEVTSL
jgi:hypothetical protein